MNAWPFVIAAYAIVILGAGALTIWSWRSMTRAEASADEVTRR